MTWLARRAVLLGACVALAAAVVSMRAEPALALAPAPSVTTGASTFLGESRVSVHGAVNPNESNVTDCHFEYGSSTSYGLVAPCEQSVGSGSEPISVAAEIDGLQAGAVYHYRLVASNEGGPSAGQDKSFATPSPPTVATSPPLLSGAGPIVQLYTAATFQGYVIANGASVTDCHFEYGTSLGFGSSVPCAQAVGAGSSPVYVSAALNTLQWATSYYVRLVASNAGGTGHGEAQPFLTAMPATPYLGSIEPPLANSYPSYVAPQYIYHASSTQTVGSGRLSPALARCLKLSGARRNKCLAAMRGGTGNPNDVGVYVAYCPRHAGASSNRAQAAGTSEKGWPPKQCLKMDKGSAGRHHTIVGERGVHNWLLGGYGTTRSSAATSAT